MTRRSHSVTGGGILALKKATVMPTGSVQGRLRTCMVLPGSRSVGTILCMALPSVKSGRCEMKSQKRPGLADSFIKEVVGPVGSNGRPRMESRHAEWAAVERLSGRSLQQRRLNKVTVHC